MGRLDRVVEGDPEARHLWFVLTVDGVRYCGARHAIDDLGWVSIVTAPMLWGELVAEQHVDESAIVTFRRCAAAERDAVIRRAGADPRTSLQFPYALQESPTRQFTVDDRFWQAAARSPSALDAPEAHLRDHAIDVLRDLRLAPGAVVVDPACSTGTFLAAVQRALPHVVTLGGDVSPAMLEVARGKLDGVVLASADTLHARGVTADVLIARYLNAEVLEVADAERHFQALAPIVRPGGHLLVLGHTPVLPYVPYWAERQGLTVLRSVGATRDGRAVFEFYVLKRGDANRPRAGAPAASQLGGLRRDLKIPGPGGT